MGDSESDVSDVWASLPKQFGAMDDYSRKSTGGGGKKRKISTVVLEDMSTEEYWEVNFEIFEREYSSLFLKLVVSPPPLSLTKRNGASATRTASENSVERGESAKGRERSVKERRHTTLFAPK